MASKSGKMVERPYGLRRQLAVSKRDCLLFDEIKVMGLERQIAGCADIDPTLAADAIYLAESEFLTEAPDDYPAVGMLLGDRIPPEIRRQVRESGGELALVDHIGSAGRHPSSDTQERLPRGGELVLGYALGVLGDACIPIVKRSLTTDEWQTLNRAMILPHSVQSRLSARDSTLLEIVIKRLPIPGDEVPLEEVLAFSRDRSSVRRRERLMIALARARLENTPAEVFDLELAEAICDYEESMAAEDFRARTGAIKVVLSASLGAIEELIHLRPRRALEALLEYREVKANRLEAELHAAGRETAFIYEADKAFGTIRRR